MRLSVIIPVLNEEEALPAFLESVARWNCVDEVLFSDGGSQDATLDMLQEHIVVTGACGRGAQCRLGAEQAKGDALVFVHADSIVPPDSMQAIRDALETGAQWGCLTLRFDDGSLRMGLGAWGSNMRVRLTGIPFGDQVMFMSRSAYESVDGMPAIPVMEDYELSRRLRTISWPHQLPQKVFTSARRFSDGGAIRVAAQMRHLRHLYRKGVDPDELAHLYKSERSPAHEAQ